MSGGMGGKKGKAHNAAMVSYLDRQLKHAKQKERMQTNIGKNSNLKQPDLTKEEVDALYSKSANAVEELLAEETIYRNGPRADRSSVKSKKGKKKK